MEKPEMWALLWSKKSNCFHIEPLERSIKAGLTFFEGDKTNDYLLIGVGARAEVESKADELRPLIDERDEVRRLYGDGPCSA